MLSLVTIALVIIGAVVLGWAFANEVDRQSSITDQLEPAAALAGHSRRRTPGRQRALPSTW